MIVDDIPALDADIARAMAGDSDFNFENLHAKWIDPRPIAVRREYARYVAERVHDVLLAWTAIVPTGPTSPPTRVP